MYNGFPTQADFHAWIQAEWAKRLSTSEGREEHRRQYGIGSTSHAACDHANAYCVQGSRGE